MKLADLIQQLNLTVLTAPKDFSNITPQGAYTSDLLSCVMAGAPFGGIWITLQAHSNIVAVAALREQCAVIISEGAIPDSATIARANQENIALLSTSQSSYQVTGQLWELGLH